MKLTQVWITYFRCFESLAVPLQPDVNVFVGFNASGKTAILDAIAIALYDIVAANGGGGKRQRALQGVNLRSSDIHIPLEAMEPVAGRQDFVQISAEAVSYYALRDFPSHTSSGEQASIEWTNHVLYRPPNDFDYNNVLAVVLDFARRLAQAHPNRDNPLEAPGILLIDEIELHLHPQWQQKIIPNLCAVFPNTQLIVATYSPQVLTTVESRNIFILRDRELRAAPIRTYGAEYAMELLACPCQAIGGMTWLS